LVEDDGAVRQVYRRLLERDGFAVFTAANGIEATRVFEREPIDLIVSDIGMPGMSGYEVARTFRADAALSDVMLVALSGYALPEDLKRAAEAGFDLHLPKPPSLEKLELLLAEPPRRARAPADA
jgi:CheY-like chemotaxis protein